MWDKLSMAEKAGIIALGVQSGITNLSEIQQLYNESQKQDQEYTPKRKFDDGGKKEKRIEIRRGVNGITSPEVLAVVNGEDEYNKWVEEHPQFKEVPNNFITEATSSLPELEITDNKDGTVTTSMSNYRNTRNKDNYTITDWWKSIPRSLDRQWNNFLQTDPIFGQRRVNNYRKALQRNPQFSDNWDMASNIAEGVNIMSGGVFNRLSPTQNIGLIIDVAKGKNFMNSWFGNSGIVPDNFAQQHPYLSFGINALGDFGTYHLPGGINPVLQRVDRLGTRKLMNQNTPNTLNRLIGTGTSGYEDALSSGVVRGNMKMGPNAKSISKQIKVLKAAGVPDETIRNYASNNISEQEFYQLKRIFDSHYGGTTKQPGKISLKRTSPFEDYETYQDYLDDQVAPKGMFMYSENPNNPQWSHSWDGHNMATFAEPGENLSNNAGLFPGDFGVQITNSPLYRQSATEFGHFAQHPTTKYPLPISNPDVTFFVRKDGLLTGTKYMSRVPRRTVLSDRQLLQAGQPVSTQPRIVYNPLFPDGIPQFQPFVPVAPKFIFGNNSDKIVVNKK